MIGGDTIRHGGGVAERGESEGGERARHKETSGVDYLERKRVDMTYGSCWFTQTC